MKQLPTEKSGERDTTAQWEYGYNSPPGVTPQYRARLGHGPETQNAKLRKSVGRVNSKKYFWQGAVHDGVKWVVVTTAQNLGVVLDAIYDVVHADLVIPAPAKSAAKPKPGSKPRKRAKRARAAKKS